MPQSRRKALIKDPHLPWIGEFPYDRLSARLKEVGRTPVAPDTAAKEVKDCFYDLMAAGVSSEDRAAWDALRLLGRRLLADFFLYETEELDVEVAAAASEMPLEMPDLLELAEAPVDLAAALRVPERLDPGPSPGPVAVDVRPGELPPLDMGPLLPPLKQYLVGSDG